MNYFRDKSVIFTLTAIIIFIEWSATETFAQVNTSETPLTWKSLGFNGIPRGLSTDELAIIESLNEGRGKWIFQGSVSKENDTKPFQGKLEINGGAKSGMLPMWALTLNWPLESPRTMINYVIMVAPEKNQVGMMLFRIGPIAVGVDGKPAKNELMKTQRIPFEGGWDLESRTILWKRTKMPGNVEGEATPQQQESQTSETESFEMTFHDTGMVTIQNLLNPSSGPAITGKAIDRIGEPTAKEKLVYNQDIQYANHSDISEPHLKRYIPTEAVDITVNLQRNGHFARYKVSENEFLSFLDQLWQGEERDKGVAVSKEDMMKQQFGRLGWKPLESATSYHSPVKPNGAMSHYYFDEKTETVYENTGYW